MNKFYLSFAVLIFALQVIVAQQDFKFVKTKFVGALSDQESEDWTKQWTNWAPQSTSYADATDLITLNGMWASLPVPGELNITNDLVLDAQKVYLLQGLVVVRNGGSLTIPAGTLIRAEANTSISPKNYASIIVERGGKIFIQGTQSAPVVITSNKSAGARNRGDWGGLLIAGRASHNLLDGTTNDNVQMEGFSNVAFDPTLARFGGNSNNDFSGEIHHLRLEFGGLAFEINKEINALTLGAVGSRTVLDHIQASYSGDDSFEWFGGSVNSKYLIAYKGTDDDFDTDNGYSGLNQFGIAVKDTNYYDLTYNATSGASTSEGFESDNEATGTASVRPLTNAIFSNYTMVGPVPVGKTYSSLSGTVRSAFRRGARIRRNSAQSIVNSIFMGYRNFLMLDGDSCVRRTNDPAALQVLNSPALLNLNEQIFFANNIICNTANAYQSNTDTTANGLVEVARGTNSAARMSALNNWVRASGTLGNRVDPVPFIEMALLVNPTAYSDKPDFKPVLNSAALTGANFDQNPLLSKLTNSDNISIQKEKLVLNSNQELVFNEMKKWVEIFDINGSLVGRYTNVNSIQMGEMSAAVYVVFDGLNYYKVCLTK
ncbi:MAG TPA: hypothetical protein PK006_09945 [Saprospiraceae bacterium]|nr:hypothetical protein [Saprospiraceae bacterium]